MGLNGDRAGSQSNSVAAVAATGGLQLAADIDSGTALRHGWIDAPSD